MTKIPDVSKRNRVSHVTYLAYFSKVTDTAKMAGITGSNKITEVNKFYDIAILLHYIKLLQWRKCCDSVRFFDIKQVLRLIDLLP